MKFSKTKMAIIFGMIVICIVVIISFILVKNKENKKTGVIEEYTPAEELSDDEIRKTIVSLYFKNIENNKLTPESICIDVKQLKDNPYKALVELLIKGPTNEKLETAIPENTQINNAYIKGDIVYIDLSKEFIENAPSGIEEESGVIYSIVNTLTELNEVNSVKVLINGEENLAFKDNAINFEKAFTRND